MNDKNESLRRIARELFDKHATIREVMCTNELTRIIDEQIKSGDFMQYIRQSGSSFALTYIPYREVDRLKQELQAAEEEVALLGEAVEACAHIGVDCGYGPYTAEVAIDKARQALEKLKEIKEQE